MKEENVVVIGYDGYIGHALTLKLLDLGYNVFGIDDYQRRKSVKEMNSFSATYIDDPTERQNLYDAIAWFEHHPISINEDYNGMCEFLKDVKPKAIVNLAQQPSAPYSFKSRRHAEFSTVNNLIGTLNVLYYMKEYAPDSHLIQIGSMGEYDPAAGTDIPEGTFDLEYKGKVGKNMIFPRRPGSIYHASKVASTYYIDAACRWWGLTATDIMQGVVYGNWTPEIVKYNSHTRLDSDECFGTIVNRFIVQAVIGEPMTIFGEGLQKRGYLALNDSVQCLMLAIDNPPKKGDYRTWNQLDTVYTASAIAGEVESTCKKLGVKTAKTHIESPRAENTGLFHYKPYVKKLKMLGFEPTRQIADEVEFALRVLKGRVDELYPLRDVVIPKITWK